MVPRADRVTHGTNDVRCHAYRAVHTCHYFLKNSHGSHYVPYGYLNISNYKIFYFIILEAFVITSPVFRPVVPADPATADAYRDFNL